MSFITPVLSHRGAGKGFLPTVESTAYLPSLGSEPEEDCLDSVARLGFREPSLGVPVGVMESR